MTAPVSLVPFPVPTDFEGPKAWVGCLNCYNNASLVGEWFDATEAADVTLTVLHLEHPQHEGCEELWVFDVDGIPVSEEMSPLEAANWGNLLNSVERARGERQIQRRSRCPQERTQTRARTAQAGV